MIKRPDHNLYNCFWLISLLGMRFSSIRKSVQFCVPNARPLRNSDIDHFTNFLQRNETLFCLTGAGISTESGIPDYRSKGVGLYDRENHKPILHQEFVKSRFHR